MPFSHYRPWWRFAIHLWLSLHLLWRSEDVLASAHTTTSVVGNIGSFAVNSSLAATATPIDLSSVMQVAASASIQLAQFSAPPALPIPRNLSGIPEYSVIARLAQGLPIVQAGIVPADTEEMVVKFMASTNTSEIESDTSLSKRASSLKVLIVGDSITQGQVGDFTWRYRIWQWFQSQGIAVQFVGPYTGTFVGSGAQPGTPVPPQPPPLYNNQTTVSGSTISVNGLYSKSVDSAFLSSDAHFANWGRAMATDQSLIQAVVANAQPDLILVALGFNDLGWFYSDCYGLVNSAQLFINNARAAKPDINIAVANVPQRTFIRSDLVSNITTYNDILPGHIDFWSNSQDYPDSTLHLVEFEQNYACGTLDCPAGYDGLHPNAWGEYQIANAFSKALIAGFGIGTTPLAIPAQNDPGLVRPLPAPSNFKVFTSPQGVSATWDPVFGAYGYDVAVSINGGPSGYSPTTVTSARWDCQWPLDGWTYAVNVRATAGDQYGPNTTTLTAVAHPQLAPPPNNVNVQPYSSDGFIVTWDPPTGPYTDSIIEYNIIYWDTYPYDCEFVTGAAFTSSPAIITGLVPGRNYLVAPVTWNANGQGLPLLAPDVVPGAGTPPVPSGLSAISNDGTSLHLSWQGSSSAGGYEVFIRNATGGTYISLANTTQTCNDDYFLFPGTNTYQFAVQAYNGNLRSNRGPGAIPPQASGSSVAPVTCAPAPSWCPNTGSAPGGNVGGCAGCGGSGGSGPATTTVLGGTTTVVSGTTTVLSGTTVVGGTKTVVGGTTKTITSGGKTSTTTVGGSTTVVGGSTVSPTGTTGVVTGGTTEVLGGTTKTITSGGKTITTIVGGTTTVVGPTTPAPTSRTTVLGGTTTTITSGGKTKTTVIGGSTSVIVGTGTKTTSSATPNPSYPSGMDGACTGPGCNHGHCTSLLCISFGCLFCSGGGGGGLHLCSPLTSCVSLGCIGPFCVDGVCKGSGCKTIGCVGANCIPSTGHCTGFNCISLGCAGADCGSNGICTGPNCSEVSCSGPDCVNGGCVGPSCTTYGTGVGGGSGAPQDNPDDGCGTDGDGVTVAPSCAVTCQTISATKTCVTDCQTTTGCSVKATTTTTTIGSNAYVIGTGYDDSYSAPSDQAILAFVSSAMASESSIDNATPASTTTPSPTTSTSTPPGSGPSELPGPGVPCNPNTDSWACSFNRTVVLVCDCGASTCDWEPFVTCENGSATCHIAQGGDCGGDGDYGACC